MKKPIESSIKEIEMSKEQGVLLPFKIVDIQENCFLIDIKGEKAYVPFERMPWTYLIGLHWNAVLFSLKEKTFLCKKITIFVQKK